MTDRGASWVAACLMASVVTAARMGRRGRAARAYLRQALYTPALVAVRFNAAMKAKYEALLAAGKPPKVALTAIMPKLIILANALIRNGRIWSPLPT
jgi:transposase